MKVLLVYLRWKIRVMSVCYWEWTIEEGGTGNLEEIRNVQE